MLTQFVIPDYLGQVHPPFWGQTAVVCLEEWNLSILALLSTLQKGERGECQGTLIWIPSPWQYWKLCFLQGSTKWNHAVISNETGFHFLLVITSSSTVAILDACICKFSDYILASLPVSFTLITASFFCCCIYFSAWDSGCFICTHYFSPDQNTETAEIHALTKPDTAKVSALWTGTRGSLAAQEIFLQTNVVLAILYFV